MQTVITNDPEKLKISLEALKEVLDPEIQLNVVDLGLIYQVDFNEAEKIIFCSMTLTTQFCPMGESITESVIDTLKKTFPGWMVDFKLIFDPPWKREMISDAGREFLNR